MINDESCRSLFVYGTLRPGSGHPMAEFLRARSHLVGAARVRGQLFDLGRFPGMLPAETPDDWVTGELVDLHDVPATLSALDRYEDAEGIFPRRMAAAMLEDGREVSAWVYWYAGSLQQAKRIASGDYLNRVRENTP